MADLDLLDRTLAVIDATPRAWDQSTWRCSTGMCLAGHGATVAGAAWVTTSLGDVQVPLADAVVDLVENHLGRGELAAYVLDPTFAGDVAWGWSDLAEQHVVHVADWTRARLGLTYVQADALFHHGNSRQVLQAMRDALAEDPDADLERIRRAAADVQP